jgi:membrane-associated phospholipid phosphatase
MRLRPRHFKSGTAHGIIAGMTPMVLLMSIGLLGWWHVVAPLQVIVAAVALAHGRWRLAVFSLTALATAIILVVAARAVVDLHPEAYRQIGVVLPSGHSALVVVTVVTLAALAWPRWSRGRVGAAVALILAVGWVMTKSGHTAGDVLVGLALGCVSVLVAGAVARIRRPRKVSPAGAIR